MAYKEREEVVTRNGTKWVVVGEGEIDSPPFLKVVPKGDNSNWVKIRGEKLVDLLAYIGQIDPISFKLAEARIKRNPIAK